MNGESSVLGLVFPETLPPAFWNGAGGQDFTRGERCAGENAPAATMVESEQVLS